VFDMQASERARIDSSGRLLVGTSTGTSRLSIEGTADNANSEILITATGIASGYIGANSNGLNIGTDTAGLVFKTGVTGGGSVGASGTERMRIDSSGRLLIGTASARSSGGHTGSFQLEGTTFATATAAVTTNSNDSNGPYLNFGKARGGSIGSTTIVQSGDVLGQIQFNGSDGTSLQNAAFITALVDGTPGANDMPGRLVFSTTADGASWACINDGRRSWHYLLPFCWLSECLSGFGCKRRNRYLLTTPTALSLTSS
jgi:hypothetical protein